MLGQIGLPGGGFGFGYSAEAFVGTNYRRFNWATLPKGRNPTGFAIPVARIADMLLNPGATVDYNGDEIVYPDTKLIYRAGGNHFITIKFKPTGKSVAQADTVIVNEPWWTPVAQWADIVFRRRRRAHGYLRLQSRSLCTLHAASLTASTRCALRSRDLYRVGPRVGFC